MDNNEFSLDDLLNCSDFSRYESMAARYAMEDFLQTVKENTDGEKAFEKIKQDGRDLAYCTFNDGFKQGFCFAVKSVKFLLKS
ncbi:MAG: hypothetical protein HDT25_03985 [Ruminococcus sp.]|nr:hypothetical protein [Ruminococcus sp.]